MASNTKYVYNGPIMKFGACIGNFKTTTWANSAAKARSNILYQFKRENNMLPSCKLELGARVEVAE